MRGPEPNPKILLARYAQRHSSVAKVTRTRGNLMCQDSRTLITPLRHSSAETNTYKHTRGLHSGGRSSKRCKIDHTNGLARPADRQTSLGIISKVGRNGGEGETYLSSLIESGRHGFQIEGGTALEPRSHIWQWDVRQDHEPGKTRGTDPDRGRLQKW